MDVYILNNNNFFKKFLPVIQWLNKQITETQLTQQRVGTFENPGATSNFRPSSSALVWSHTKNRQPKKISTWNLVLVQQSWQFWALAKIPNPCNSNFGEPSGVPTLLNRPLNSIFQVGGVLLEKFDFWFDKKVVLKILFLQSCYNLCRWQCGVTMYSLAFWFISA